MIFSLVACNTQVSNGEAVVENNVAEMNQDLEKVGNRRVPAEWEEQEATWIQWPTKYETSLRAPMARVIKVVQEYEAVHILTSTEKEKAAAQTFLAKQGVEEKNVIWHIIAIDNSWMRDNGPIYVTDGSNTWIQNWAFTGWDGSADAEYDKDNLVPNEVAKYLNMEVEDLTDYVLEKGNLEVNGAGVALLNWDCQDQRNPGMTQAQHEKLLKEKLGLNKIIWAYGHFKGELTTGHIDGTARFVDEDTIIVIQYEEGYETGDNLAKACEKEGYEVIRVYGDVNYLIGNGFIVAGGYDNEAWNKESVEELQALYPNHDIHLIDVNDVWEAGGGIHCLTNDQPK